MERLVLGLSFERAFRFEHFWSDSNLNSLLPGSSMIGTLVRALGKNPLQKEVDEWIAALGGPDASLDVAAVKKYYSMKLPKPRDQERDMREAFKVLDIQGKGFINEAELRQIMCTLGEPLTQEEFNLLMTKCEKDSDGTILYDQFVDMLISD